MPAPSFRPLAVPLALLLSMMACGGDDGGGASTDGAATMSTGGSSSTSGSSGRPTTGGGDGSSSGEGSTVGVGGAESGDGSSSTSSSGVSSSSDGGESSEGGESSSSEGGESSSSGGETPGGEMRVLQLNLCHSGLAGCFTGDPVMDKAVSVIKDVGPGLVTLNEVCRDDVAWLASHTGAVDHRFTPALRADNTPVKCKNGDDYGNGLLSWFAPKWKTPVTGVYAKQSSQTERRVWICMGYEKFVGCTTHLSTAGDTAMAQCKELVGGALSTAAADGPAVMAGDWNLKYKGSPNAQDCVMDGFYRKGDGALQHVLASDHFGFIETVVIDMDGTTDHPGLEVRLTLP